MHACAHCSALQRPPDLIISFRNFPLNFRINGSAFWRMPEARTLAQGTKGRRSALKHAIAASHPWSGEALLYIGYLCIVHLANRHRTGPS